MPLMETSGNVTVDAYAGGAATKVKYIEDFFVTWLRTGTGASATVTTGLDASVNKALVWTKSRSAATDHKLTDTVRGATKALISDTTGAQTTDTNGLTAFSSTGYTIGTDTNYNNSGATYVDWEFVATPKFFDVVTYTGNGANRTISHALGSTPGCIIVKRTDTTGNWQVYHNSLTSAAYSIQLNLTNAQASATTVWNSTAPTSTVFSVGTDATVNANGGTYVAYLFAHNAGGFGLTGTDNVISCGSFTTDGSGNATVNLGYEPQWVLMKNSNSPTSWGLMDVMRGFPAQGNSAWLAPDGANIESLTRFGNVTATGLSITGFSSSATYIYIAIRRGPMKVPTDATKVFVPITANAAAGTAQTTGFVIDSQWKAKRAATDTLNTSVDDRLRGVSTTSTTSGNYLITSGTAAEATTNATTQAWNNTGFQIPTYYASASDIFYNFGRAPGFFDEVCYTGNGTNPRYITHNLGVVPEFMIVKRRGATTQNWLVYHSSLGAAAGLNLNTVGGSTNPAYFWYATPTSSQFSTQLAPNSSGDTYVAYLFASCPGVSKVGSYTGTGATQTISCGFTGGARFVLIKRTDSTGDWYVWDSARGMVSGTDPSLLLNSTAAEVNANSVYTTTGGFQIVSTAAGINASGGTYLFFAVS